MRFTTTPPPGLPPQPGQQARSDAARTAVFLGALAFIGLVPTMLVADAACAGGASRLMVWALGLWASGAAVGFLFGIPKVLQGAAAPPRKVPNVGGQPTVAELEPSRSSLYQQRVNTNLEEISDWLTKIIVGMGLVELRQMPLHIRTLGAEVVGSSGAACDPTFGVAVALFFLVAGFLFGYLVTRLYMQGALARAEASVAAEVAVALLELRAESAEAELQAVKQVAPAPSVAPAQPTSAAAPSQDIVDGLRGLAEEYRAIQMPSLRARIDAKNHVAARMYAYVKQNSIQRDWLAEQDDEVVLLALATLVQAEPLVGDAQRILKAASKAQKLHIRYKVVLALAKLWDARIARPEDRDAILRVLDSYSPRADASLLRLIAALREKLDSPEPA